MHKAYIFCAPQKIHFVFFHSLKLTGIIPNTDQISIVSKPVLGKQGSVLN